MSQSITGIMQLPANANMNKIVMPGCYAGATGGVTNGPDGTIVNTYALKVEANSANTTTITQEITFRANSMVRIFRRFGTNTTGSDPLGGSFTFGAWEEMPTPSGGFTTPGTVKAGLLESTGRVRSSISVETVTGTFTGNITCVALTQTSDETKKDAIVDVTPELITLVKSLVAKQYIFNDDPEEIIHFGFLAQDVIAAFEAHDLDYKDYSLVQEVVVEDAEGNATTHYALNYTELMLLRGL